LNRVLGLLFAEPDAMIDEPLLLKQQSERRMKRWQQKTKQLMKFKSAS
jgi:hypothetical protein